MHDEHSRTSDPAVGSTRLLAEKIVAAIMTAGGGEGPMAWRVALMDRLNNELCGWGKKPLTDRIEDILKANAAGEPQPACDSRKPETL